MQYPIPEEFFLRGFYTSFLFFLGFNLYFFNRRQTACQRVYAFTLFLSALTMVNSSTLSMVFGPESVFGQQLQSLCYIPLVPAFGILLVSLIWGESRRSRLWAYFLLMDFPFLLFIVLYVYTRSEMILPISTVSAGIYGYTMYAFAILRMRKYKRQLFNSYSDTEHRDLDWGRPFLITLPILLAVFLCFGIVPTGFLGAIADMAIYVVFAITLLCSLAKYIVLQEPVDYNLLLSTEYKPVKEAAAEMSETNEIAKRLLEDFEEKELYLRTNLTIKEVASVVGVYVADLSDYLNDKLGKNFNRYVNELRIEHACRLLRDTTMTVEEVGQASGFANQATFWRIFQVIREVTPDQYLHQLLAAPQKDPDSSDDLTTVASAPVVPPEGTDEQQVAAPQYDLYTNFILQHPLFRQKLADRYPSLSMRERELCMLIAMGKNNSEVAEILGVGEASLRVFRSRLRTKVAISRSESLELLLADFADESRL